MHATLILIRKIATDFNFCAIKSFRSDKLIFDFKIIERIFG